MKYIETNLAPAAVGPYSQAVVHQGIIYASGQIGLDPATGSLVGDDVASQTTRLMENLAAVLQAAGSHKNNILKVNIYLTNMDDFNQVNALYAAWLGDHRPARATVAVAALPLGAKVEMDLSAYMAND